MKILFASTLILFSAAFVYAQETKEEPIDGPQRTVIYQFTDLSPAVVPNDKNPNDKKKKPAIAESFSYLSMILPSNLERDIGSSGKFVVEIIPSQVEWLNEKTDVNAQLDALSALAKKNDAQFVVVGSYAVVQSHITIKVYAFANRAKKIISISIDREKVGVMFDSIITELSTRSASEMERYILKRADPPSILPEQDSFDLYNAITLVPSKDGDEIWYTTDGSEPSREDGSLYKDPIMFRKSAQIRAVTYHEGLYVSKPADKNVTIVYPLSRFTVGQSFSDAIFFGSWKNSRRSDGNNLFSAFVQWEFANIESLKSSAYTRDLGLTLTFDSLRTQNSNNPGSDYMMMGMLNLLYTARLADFLSLDFTIGAGVTRASSTASNMNNNGGWRDMFNLPGKDSSTPVNKPLLGGALRMNYIFGHFFLHADTGFRVTQSAASATVPMLTLGIGAGWRF